MTPPFNYKCAILSILEKEGPKSLTELVDCIDTAMPRDIVKVRVLTHLQLLRKDGKVEKDNQTLLWRVNVMKLEKSPGVLSDETNQFIAGAVAAGWVVLAVTVISGGLLSLFDNMFLVSKTKDLLIKEGLTNIKYEDTSSFAPRCTKWSATEFNGTTKTVCIIKGKVFIPIKEATEGK